ncbi:MAG: diguanylate cyclase, partial [Azoarcus sp.]|nr:diguanylate cyclase [Azoarcus sp.]
MGEADALKLLHELQVHQVELRLQNEELRQTQAQLEASRALYFELYELAPVAYCTLGDEGMIIHANLVATTLLGTPPGGLLDQPIRRFIRGNEHHTFAHHIEQLGEPGDPQSCELQMTKQDGAIFWARLRSVSTRSADGIRSYLIAFADITESKRADDALREQKEFFHLIADNLSDFIAVLDLEGRRIYNSPSYQQFFGAAEDLRNTDSFADVHPDDRERVRQVFQDTVRTSQGYQIEYRFIMADGNIRNMESRASVIKDKDGQVARVVVVSVDITERKHLQEQVRQMAFHDVLTGLPNRRLFSDRLNQALAAGTRLACHGALMFLDLDNFKPLNDTHGHDVGDLLLVEAANRLKRCVREMDTVARFGGDEFVVMLSQLEMNEADSTAQARTVAEKLCATLSEPYLLKVNLAWNAESTVEHRCTVSIGVALFNDHQESPSGILRCADLAMYRAKQAGGNQVRFCDNSDRVTIENIFSEVRHLPR